MLDTPAWSSPELNDAKGFLAAYGSIKLGVCIVNLMLWLWTILDFVAWPWNDYSFVVCLPSAAAAILMLWMVWKRNRSLVLVSYVLNAVVAVWEVFVAVFAVLSFVRCFFYGLTGAGDPGTCESLFVDELIFMVAAVTIAALGILTIISESTMINVLYPASPIKKEESTVTVTEIDETEAEGFGTANGTDPNDDESVPLDPMDKYGNYTIDSTSFASSPYTLHGIADRLAYGARVTRRHWASARQAGYVAQTHITTPLVSVAESFARGMGHDVPSSSTTKAHRKQM